VQRQYNEDFDALVPKSHIVPVLLALRIYGDLLIVQRRRHLHLLQVLDGVSNFG